MRSGWKRFVGSVNLVAYTPSIIVACLAASRLREWTTVEKKRAELPDRLPFEKTIELVNGEGQDIQVFGFDLAEVPRGQRAQAQDRFLGAVEVVNQELFVNDEDCSQ